MGRRLEAELVMPPERTPVSRAKAPVRTPLAWVLLPSFLAALPVLLAIFGGPEVKQTRWDAWGVLVWFALLVAAEALPVAMLRGATMTIASILDVGAILLFGPWIAGFLDLCTTGVAQVLIAWLPNGQGWTWLEQRDRDLHVHLASASDGARLRGHEAWLRHTMPVTAGEPLRVRLVVRRFTYRIVIATSAGAVVREAGISAGDGWRLFTPGEREGGPWTTLLTAGWMAGLLWPLGYLASARSRAAVVVAALSAGVTLLLLSIVSGCAWLPLGGWCGAASGLLVGSHTRAPFKRGSGSD